MYAIEFEAHIGKNIVHIPEYYKNINKVHAKVILLTEEPKCRMSTFNPRSFFGLGKQSKQDCDAYIADVLDG